MCKYQKWYDALMVKAQNRNWSRKSSGQYVEQHHIIPKSLGGTNDKSNLVFLTSREHCIAHLLLCRFGDEHQKSKMIWALQRFLTTNKTVSSVLYESTRKMWIEEHTKKLIGNKRRLGIKDTDEVKKKKSQSMLGVVGKWKREEKHKKELSERMTKRLYQNNPMNNPASRNKVSQSKIGRKRIYREDGSFYMSKI
jgi:hypothetical protein